MYRLSLVAVGNKMPDWVNQGFEHYQKQIKRRVDFTLVEIAAEKRSKQSDLSRISREEEKRVLKAIPDKFQLVALDRNGRSWSSVKFAKNMGEWIDLGTPTAFIIGGPEGLSDDFVSQCKESWSLSDLTLSHTIARLVFAEQLYRCFSIIDGGPYHR